MKRIFRISIITILLSIFGASMARALPTDADVTVGNISASEVTLNSSASADKSKEAQEQAVQQAFYALLHQGIEGLHSGQPMMAGDSKQFDYSFYKDGKYLDFLAATPVKEGETKVGSRRRVTMVVTIRYKALLNYLKQNKQNLNAAWVDKESVTAKTTLNPTIVVVPVVKGEDQSFEAMKRLVDSSPVYRQSVEKVSSMFASRGYKTRDFLTMLQNSKTSDLLREGTQTDTRTMVAQELPGDIVVNVDITVYSDGVKKSSCSVLLNAVERQTSGKLCSQTFQSGEYLTTDYGMLTDYALSKIESKFFDQIDSAFKSMVENGREVSLEFNLSETVSDWDFDSETPETEEDFKPILEDWLRSKANHGVADMSVNTGKYIAATINIPLWDNEKGRSYTLTNFNTALKKFLRKHLGDGYKVNATAMGQKILITIE